MTHYDTVLTIMKSCLILLSLAAASPAASPRENALAAVAVARARVKLAAKKAELDDSPEHFIRSFTSTGQEDLSAIECNNASLADREPLSQIRLEISAAAVPVGVPVPRAQLIVESIDGCRPCLRLKQEIRDILGPKGWTIGEDEAAQIRFHQGTEDSTYPRISLLQNGELIDRWYGYQDPGFLSQRLRQSWESAREPVQGITSAGSAGTIHGRRQIRQGIDHLRKYVGDGHTVTVIWERSEARLNLLAGLNWETKDLWGMSGRIQLDAPTAIQLPVRSFSTGYQIVGRDVKLTPEPFVLIGLAELMGPKTNRVRASMPQPAQIAILDDSLLLYSVAQMLQAVFDLLHPSADFVIPDQLIATMTLTDDSIIVDFEKSPSVCLKWLFTFNLAVKRVEVSESNAHVDFTGSRIIKSRDFRVQ